MRSNPFSNRIDGGWPGGRRPRRGGSAGEIRLEWPGGRNPCRGGGIKELRLEEIRVKGLHLETFRLKALHLKEFRGRHAQSIVDTTIGNTLGNIVLVPACLFHLYPITQS